MLTFDGQRFTNGLLATVDDAPELFGAACQQERIEFIQITRGRHRNQVIAAKEPGFAFDATLFMTLAGRTELGFKTPMRAECDKARCLLAPMAAQDFLHR